MNATGQKLCGVVVLKPILVFSIAQAEQYYLILSQWVKICQKLQETKLPSFILRFLDL